VKKKRIHLTDQQIRKRMDALGLDGAHSTQAHLDAERALIEGRCRRKPKIKKEPTLIYGPGE
jgi:hypothetical protein